MRRRILPVALLLALAACRGGEEPPPATRLVATGHGRSLYPEFLDLYRELAREINRAQPDHVFLLGDLLPHWRPPLVAALRANFLELLEFPVHFAPGNHEMRHGPENYARYVDYTTRWIRDPHANFVIMNSAQPFERWRDELLPLLDAIEREAPDLPTVLLTHHRLWVDYAGIPFRIRQTRPFAPEQALAFLSGRVDHIVAGDAVADFETRQIGDLRVWAVGIGFPGQHLFGARHPVYFAVGTIGADGALRMEPRYLEIPEDHAWRQPRPSRRRGRGRRAPPPAAAADPPSAAWRPGDVNLDRRVDGGDLRRLDDHLRGGAALGCAGFLAADVDGSGAVDAADRQAIAATLGRACGPGSLPCRAPDPMPGTFLAPLASCGDAPGCRDGESPAARRLPRPERETGPTDVRFLSFNLDGWGLSRTTGARKPLVLEILRDHRPDVVGLQEVVFAGDLVEQLNRGHPAGYVYAAVGPTMLLDPLILYRADRFEIPDAGEGVACCDAGAWAAARLARSDPPAACAPGGGAPHPMHFCDPARLPERRVALRAGVLQSGSHGCGAPEAGVHEESLPVAWAHLRDRRSGAGFHVYDLHACPPRGGVTRARGHPRRAQRNRVWSVRQVAIHVNATSRADADPVVLLGDLNDGEDSEVVRYLVGDGAIPDPYAAYPGFADAAHPAPVPSPRLRDTLRVFDSRSAFATFQRGRRFDYILASDPARSAIEVCAARVVERFDAASGLEPSDHKPLTALLQIGPAPGGP